jgi:hypothetical protein
MDNKLAKTIIMQTFENKFDKLQFSNFIVELLNLDSYSIKETQVTYEKDFIPNTYRPYINSFEKIASYSIDGDGLDVLIVELARESSVERARTMQRNFVAWYLKGNCDGQQKDASLVAFVSPDKSDWRFSYIKMDYSIKEDEKGRAKISEQFSPKRWSFLVGLNERSHTAQAQLVDIVKRDDKNITLGQIEEAFSVEKVTKEFFEKYRDLFFRTNEALEEILTSNPKVRDEFENKNIKTSDFAKKLLGQIVFLYFLQKKGWFGIGRDKGWGTGPKDFLRRLFDGKHGKYNNFFDNILEPLFYEALRYDRSYDDHYYSRFNCKIPFLNGGLFDPLGDYNWVHTDISLPNELFSNHRITKEGDAGDGILNIFDRYNFTVKEDEPLEKEVAVDPEMLGKVFENLLEVKDRKSKGTYYTPREIVHYMCQQSLINYLETELEGKVSIDDIETLINIGEKIGDDTESSESLDLTLPGSIVENAELIDQKLASVKVCDPAVGSGAFLVGMMSEIVRIRNILSKYINNPERANYNFKRECIEHSLYGVDIDPGAVEIAKLRLWLSLVVDEEDIKDIKPLPNLDYKIVCGNSLLGVEINLFNQEAFSKLEKLKPIYFSETDIKKKKEYKRQIDELIFEVTDGHKEFDFEVYFSEVFHENKGFDIVIGNPPYETSRSKGIDYNTKKYLRENYETAEDKYDYYTFFIERASKLTRKTGHVCFITPSTYLLKPLSRKIRKYLLFNFTILDIIEFKGLVFKAVVPTAIIIFMNITSDDNHEISINYNIESIRNFIDGIFLKKKIKQILFNRGPNYYINIYSDEFFINLFERLSTGSSVVKLGDLAEIYNGIQTGNDKKFICYEKKSTKHHKVLTGSDIRKYYKKWGGKYVYYEPEVLHSNTRLNIFKTDEKIIIRQTSDRIIGAYDNEGYFSLASTFVIKQFNKLISYKSLLAILNSNLFLYIYRNINNEEGRVLPQIKKKHIFDLPIKLNFYQHPIDELVEKILKITKEGDYLQNKNKKNYVSEYENQIDQMVYELYGITPEEIEIVENASRNQ